MSGQTIQDKNVNKAPPKCILNDNGFECLVFFKWIMLYILEISVGPIVTLELLAGHTQSPLIFDMLAPSSPMIFRRMLSEVADCGKNNWHKTL